jgi:hypothetical protein
MHFTWKTRYLFDCTSAFVIGILLKLRVFQTPRMRYKPCKFGCDRSLNTEPYWSTIYPFDYISESIGVISLQLDIFHYTLLRFNHVLLLAIQRILRAL